MNRLCTLGRSWYCLLQFLNVKINLCYSPKEKTSDLTRLSNTHLFKDLSGLRHWYSWWLLLSRHSQCFRNSSKQCFLISSILQITSVNFPAHLKLNSRCLLRFRAILKMTNLHTCRASCNFPAFPHAISLACSLRLGFAYHKIIIEGLTSRSNEIGRAE